ncbi:AAA family ATPase [Helicobacter cynogastricus]|uniref:AAA family ATPase n=1 Tax=Helicobacter cynogastricus TaxID=329937 RepID=UPI000CF1B8BC|nr:AAA family ATPase [Helicobacter cynogastricus]
MSYKSRVKNLIAELEKDLFEREECVRLVLLAMFAGKAIFLYGPPGTAKSMIARKVSLAFGEPKDFFSALMHRFSTPEDIFGPIDIGQLKQNRLVRNTKGYLPTASFAFLDEIWKSSPAILNTLLTIINERLFKEGDTDIKVPLKGIVCASNEFPPTNQGLEALYDRMLLRYFVEPLKSKENFLKLITSQEGKSSSQHAFSLEELESIHQQAAQIPFSPDALESLHTIKVTLEQLKHNPALVAKFLGESAPTKEEQESTEPDSNLITTPSDRRFKQCAQLLQVAALLSDQPQVSTPDLALLRHCLWDSLEQIPLVNAILAQCLKSSHTKAKDFQKAQENFSHLEKMTTDSLKTFTNACQYLHKEVTTHIQELNQELRTARDNINIFLSNEDIKTAFAGPQELLQKFKVLELELKELDQKVAHVESQRVHNATNPRPPQDSLEEEIFVIAEKYGIEDISKLAELLKAYISSDFEPADLRKRGFNFVDRYGETIFNFGSSDPLRAVLKAGLRGVIDQQIRQNQKIRSTGMDLIQKDRLVSDLLYFADKHK